MAYFIRILTPKTNSASRAGLENAARAHGASVAGDLNTDGDQLVVTNSSGHDVCAIERNAVSSGSMAEEEIAEFQVEIASCLPYSAGIWLQSYLKSVRTIYAFEVLSGAYMGNGWEIVGSVKAALQGAVGGIVQADSEGFSNEEGYHILWQFSDDVTGEWWMAVLKDGAWAKFRMDLGNQTQRTAFMAGEIPV